MQRLTAWLAGAAGGLAAYRLLRRRSAGAVEPPAEPDERADELRTKLAESREQAAAEPHPEPGHEPEPPDVEQRRRSVHEQGKAAIDEMRGGGPASRD
jgi:hypothetical protein